MVKNIFKSVIAAVLVMSMAACTGDDFGGLFGGGERMSVSVSASHDGVSRAVFSDGAAKWTPGERIGVVAAANGEYTDGDLQTFVGQNSELAQATTFLGNLADGGNATYRLYGYSPLKTGQHSEVVNDTLPWIQHPQDGGWDVNCDFMTGISAEQNCANVGEATAPLTFSHKVGWLKLSFNGFTECANEKVMYVRVSANVAIAGGFTVDLKNQTINTAGATDKYVIADYSDKNITLGDLNAYITMFPVTGQDINIAVKTTSADGGHYIQCARTGLTLAAGELKDAPVNAQTDEVSVSQEDLVVGQGLPQMTSKTEGQLNVLLIGHSFGIDCTEHLPGLLQAAGITNFNLCRFYSPDCQLDEFWNNILTDTPPSNYYQRQGATMQNITSGKNTINQRMKDTKWDIIILQQSTCDGRQQVAPNWGGCCDYSTYQPYLSLMLEYIVSTQKSYQNNTPYIAWNMIQVSKTDVANKYNRLVTATNSMKAETGIPLIITPGTAMQVARNTTGQDAITQFGWDFSDAHVYKLLCRDVNGDWGWHASDGNGRYLQACAWFEQLVVPIYAEGCSDVRTVVGNTFLPDTWTATGYSGDNDKVTAEKAAALQKIAHYTALHNPYYSTNPYWNGEIPVVDPVYVSSITLDHNAINLNTGGQQQLTATVSPGNADNTGVNWSSNNTEVATVNSSGVVVAVGAGSATITASAADGHGAQAQCTVTVTAGVPVTGVSLNKNATTLVVDEIETLTATITPSDATNKSVTWTSDNTNVATVANGVVTARQAGTATIRVTTADGGYYAECAVTVNNPAPVAVTSVTLNKAATSIAVGANETLTATVNPSNATNKAVTWSTSNGAVATVSNGVVTGVAEGEATITVTSVADNTKTASCVVTVSAPTPPPSGGTTTYYDYSGNSSSDPIVFNVSSMTKNNDISRTQLTNINWNNGDYVEFAFFRSSGNGNYIIVGEADAWNGTNLWNGTSHYVTLTGDGWAKLQTGDGTTMTQIHDTGGWFTHFIVRVSKNKVEITSGNNKYSDSWTTLTPTLDFQTRGNDLYFGAFGNMSAGTHQYDYVKVVRHGSSAKARKAPARRR